METRDISVKTLITNLRGIDYAVFDLKLCEHKMKKIVEDSPHF